jgi:hypothetical protein
MASRPIAVLALAGLLLAPGGPLRAQEAAPTASPGTEPQRPRIEWISLQIGPGLQASAVRLALITLRWEHVYLQVLRGQFDFLGSVSSAIGGHGGVAVGVSFPLGAGDRRELRAGVCLAGGRLMAGRYYWQPAFAEGTDKIVVGAFLLPELSFLARNARGVALVVTLGAELGPGGQQGTWYDGDLTDTRYCFYANALLLLGVAY